MKVLHRYHRPVDIDTYSPFEIIAFICLIIAAVFAILRIFVWYYVALSVSVFFNLVYSYLCVNNPYVTEDEALEVCFDSAETEEATMQNYILLEKRGDIRVILPKREDDDAKEE